mgnify:CR=1 FL=1
MRIVLLCWLLIILVVNGKAWAGQPPDKRPLEFLHKHASDRVLEIGQIGEEPVSLTEYFSILEDPSAELTLTEIQHPDIAGRFISGQQKSAALSYGVTRLAIWLRLRVSNNTDHTIERILEISYARLSDVQFHHPGPADSYQSVLTGEAKPFATRPYKNRHFVFPVTIAAHSEQILYVRVKSDQPMLIPAKMWDPQAFYGYERGDYTIQIWYFGMATAIILFNLLLFIAMRDVIYLMYSSFGVSIVIFFASSGGLAHEFLWPHAQWSANIAASISALLFLAAYMLFTRRMLNTKQTMPKFDRVLKAMVASSLLIGIGIIVSQESVVKIGQLYLIASLALILSIAVYGAINHQRTAYLFLLAFSIFLAGTISYFLRALGWLPHNTFTANGMQLGSALEMLLQAFALADRYNQLRREKDNALLQAVQAQESATLNKDSFLATIGHEFRTPMHGVIGNLVDLSNDPRTATDERVLLALQSSQVMERLVDRILLFAEASAGKLENNPRKFTPISAIGNLIADLSSNYPQTNIQIDLRMSDTHSIQNIDIDSTQLLTALQQIIDNSCKFGAHSDVIVTLGSEETDSDAEFDLFIQICDQGPGIPPDKQRQVMEAFRQADQGFDRKHNGLGVGLSLSVLLIRILGGKLKIDTPDTGGCRITITVPTRNSTSTETTRPEKPSNNVRQIKNVLIAEDNPVNQKVLSARLRKMGCTIDCADNGKKATEMFASNSYDMVFMDCQMPIMDGFEATKIIRAMGNGGATVPIIAVTGNVMTKERKYCLTVGMDEVLAKPLKKGELETTVMRYQV